MDVQMKILIGSLVFVNLLTKAVQRNVIELLRDDEFFACDTPEGTYAMTKKQFYQVFANVAASKSYLVGGSYNYKAIPEKAQQFLVRNK